MTTWNELKKELDISEEDRELIAIEEELLLAVSEIREAQGMTQKELAEKAHIKQSAIARMEKMGHFPRIDSLLRVLLPLGYTLRIVPKNQS